MPSKPANVTMDAVYTAPGYLFRRMQQIAVAIFMEECRAYDLTPVQFAALVAIHTHPGIDATRLSAVIAFDRSTLGNVIERLETKGYIERKPSSGDKRIKLLVPDQIGRGAAARDHALGRSRAGADAAAAEAGRPQDADGAADATGRSQQRGVAGAAARRRRARTSREGRLMAASNTRPVLIAGGGIGGLAAALGLAQKGIASILLEKASALGEIGAGIQLGPNAFHAFDYLGVGEAARGMAVYIDQLRLMDALTAEEITHVDLRDAFRSRFGNPYGVVHRGDLHGVFLKACRDHELIELRVSSEVIGYDQDGSSVTAQLASGERVTGSLLIGADGLWSNIRKQVTADGPPRVSGHTTYRSVIPTEEMPEDLRWNAATLWAGPKCHIVHYPLSGWKVFNLVVTYHNDAPEPVAGKPVSDEEVMQGFAHVHERAQRHHPPRQELEALGVVRPRSHRALGRRPRRAARRCRAPDAAIFRARRLPGDGGRGVPVAHAGQPTPTITRPRWSNIARSAFRAPRACSCCPAPSASTSIIPPANTRASATPS